MGAVNHSRVRWRLPILGIVMAAPRKYPDEFRERAVRLVREALHNSGYRTRPAGLVKATRVCLPIRVARL